MFSKLDIYDWIMKEIREGKEYSLLFEDEGWRSMLIILDAFRRRLAGNKKLDGLFNLDITLKHLCLHTFW